MANYNINEVQAQQLNEYDQRLFVVTNSITPFEIKRIIPANGETGTILIRYNASDNNATKQLTANRYKLVRYIKTFAGVLTIENTTTLYTNNSTGANTVDFTVTSNAGDIVLTVTGTANLVMHTMRTEMLSGVLS